jgi:DNA-binding response OmpR family regulator
LDGASKLAGSRVLLVEDEALVSLLLQDTLEEFGCELVGQASRFDDAFEKARTMAFDVAILDVNLHGRDTLAIAEALAARGRPFVFATGYGTHGLPESLRSAPVLQKPFHQKELEGALLAALRRAEPPVKAE